MARGNNRNTNIGVGLDTSGIAEGVQQVTGALRGLTAEVRKISEQGKQAAEPLAQSFKNVKDTSGLAGAGVMAMTGIISDANYGIRGIANNLQQFSGLMVTLVTQTGSVAAAFKSLWSAIMGPLGIMLAFTTGIALLERYGMQSEKARKETDKLAKATQEASDKLNQESAVAVTLFETLKDLIKSNGSLNDKKKIASEINTKYNKTLDAESLTLESLAKAYKEVQKAIITKVALEASQEDLRASYDGQQKAQKTLNKLYAEQKTIMDSVRAGENEMGERGLSVQQQQRLLELSKEIAAYEGNKNRHLSAQVGISEKIVALQRELLELEDTKKDPEKKTKSKSIDALKDIQNDFDQRNELIHDLFIDMAKTVEAGGDLMSFKGKLIGIKLGDGIEAGMKTINEKLPTVVKPIIDASQKLLDAMNQHLERFVEDSLYGLFDALGASLVDGGDSIKQFGQNLLAEFGSFLQQMGGMIMAYGIGMEAFKKAFSNPIAAIAAGAALIAIGGAIKAAHKKKFGHGESAMGGATSYVPSSSGYGGQGNEVYIYSRLDGRDIILSSERSGYIMRR